MKTSIALIFVLRLIAVSFAFGSCLVRAEPVTYVSEDHLVPRNPSTDGALRPVLEKKLFLTPADCALVLIRSPESGESAVAVYSSRAGDFADGFFVTVTKADKNIDMTLAVNEGSIEATNKIRVTRCDAEISKSAALAVRAAWEAMLSRTQKAHFYARPTLHREELEFSLVRKNEEQVFATVPNKGGRSVTALVRLAKQLEAYCGASAGERGGLAKRIERDAKRLVAVLRRRKDAQETPRAGHEGEWREGSVCAAESGVRANY